MPASIPGIVKGVIGFIWRGAGYRANFPRPARMCRPVSGHLCVQNGLVLATNLASRMMFFQYGRIILHGRLACRAAGAALTTTTTANTDEQYGQNQNRQGASHLLYLENKG